MFKKLLVANRGEIALRVMRTCKEMGIATVAVYSEADDQALHVQEADEAYCIGPPPAEESYLNIDSIIDAAVTSGAQAVHPGYGFLSENPDFAEACASARLVFVGPSPEAMRLLGDKAAAKRLAISTGVPVVPGYQGRGQTDATLLRKAREIGFPVLIKAARGGGGRGMRLVYRESEFMEAAQGARREATSAFGDGSLLLEKFLERPRHIEVQIIGDGHGNLLSLGERECSLQRRYQKVVEESPSPAVGPGLRQQMERAALDIGAGAGYTNAGTVEFLLDTDGAFYFLEVNTRLQVEHPVTEWVTGLDLVQLQLMVAYGQPLPLKQDDVVLRGCSIEARIYAEDPGNDYLPGAGLLSSFTPPSGPWVRNDLGVYQGYEVPIYYDSLLAKLTVYGQDRRQAVMRLRRALGQYVIAGVATNLEMLRAIASDPDFEKGRIDTQFLARRIEPLMKARDQAPPEAVISATAYKLASFGLLGGNTLKESSGGDDPWQVGGPWRLNRAGIEFHFGHRGQSLKTRASRRPGTGHWEIEAGGEIFDLELSVTQDGRVQVRSKDERWTVEARPLDDGLLVRWKGVDYLLGEPPPASILGSGPGSSGSETGTTLEAPMPGLVARVRVSEGDEVSARQTLVVLEAMKMEHLISAPYAGVVKSIHCKEGQQVTKGAILMELERR